MAGLRVRQAVRGLMIDPSDRVLMVEMVHASGWTGWILPGGGIEPSESSEEALRRELQEETGAVDVFVGPVVLRRRHMNPEIVAGFDGQEESVYLVPCREFELAPAMSVAELRAEGVVGARWWTLDEMHSTDEQLVPNGLVALIGEIFENGAPDQPLLIDETD